MLALHVLCSALLALDSVTSAAPAPAPAPSPDNFKGLTAVEFKGKTLYVNTTALVKASSLPSPNKRSTLVRRYNVCGTSSIEPAASGPYAQVSDCWVIRDYVNTHDYSFQIPNSINVWAALISYKTCTFKAQTKNIETTWVGSGDVSDLIRDSINQLAYQGVVGAHGSMPCPNANGISGTRWEIVP